MMTDKLTDKLTAKLSRALLACLATGFLLQLTPPAWPAGQNFEQSTTLRPIGAQQTQELLMLAHLRSRRQALEQAAAFLATQPQTSSLGEDDRVALALLNFNLNVFELSGDGSEQVVKAKIFADTRMLPEDLDEYLQSNTYTIQGVKRNLSRAKELETGFDAYLTALTRTRSPKLIEELRTTQGKPLTLRYQAMRLFQDGMASLRLQRLVEAKEIFSKALALDPSYDQALMMRGLTSLRNKEFDPALADFNQALKLRPDDEVILLLRASALTEQGALPQQAIAELTRLLQRNPRLARAYMLRAQNYIDLQRCQEAILDFKSACALGDKDACNSDCRNQRRRRWR